MKPSSTRRGFTLLETLVMLAVLAIFTLLLAGVLKLQRSPLSADTHETAEEQMPDDDGPSDG